MYAVALNRNFIARHFLVGGDWGKENKEHPHHYRLEVQLEGTELDEHGYLVDIVDIETCLGELVTCYSEHVLNELPQFKGINPSIEHFSRVFCEQVSDRIRASNVKTVSVKVWENESTWASYRKDS